MSFVDQNNFIKIVNELQEEAVRNRLIMSELAGMEKYVSETYVSRVFYEIIQNADDCNSTKFHAFYENKNLYIFNNGRKFSEEDFQALCRSAKSYKKRGEQIGYRGIGFKSVEGVSQKVSLLSGDLEVFFSREKTQELFDIPSEVPLLRVPHKGSINDEYSFRARSYMKDKGLNTCFILHNIQEEKVLNDMRGMNLECMIFLKSLEETNLKIDEESLSIKIENKSPIQFLNDEIRFFDRKIKQKINFLNLKTFTSDISNIKDKGEIEEQEIRVWKYKNIDIATNIEEKKIIRLAKNDAYTHAFLPMLTTTGVGARINGDFSTDPSRSRLSPDENTKNKIDSLIDLMLVLLKRLDQELITKDEKDLLEILIPYKKSQNFSISPSYISNKIKEKIFIESNIDMQNFLLKPNWANIDDYKKMAAHSNKKFLIFDQVSDVDYYEFFNNLGAEQPNLISILLILSDLEISEVGLYAFVESILKKYLGTFNVISSKGENKDLAKHSKIFICNDGIPRSGKELSYSDSDLTVDYMYLNHIFNIAGNSFKSIEFCELCGLPPKLIPLNFITPFLSIIRSINRPFYREILQINGLEKQVEAKRITNNILKENLNNLNYITKANIIKKERKEVQNNSSKSLSKFNMAEILLKDKVSEIQTVSGVKGYDLKGKDEYGKDIFVVIKTIDHVGEDIPIKNIELTVAKNAGYSYWVVIFLKSYSGSHTHFSVIPNFYSFLGENIKSKPTAFSLCCTEYQQKVPFSKIIDHLLDEVKN